MNEESRGDQPIRTETGGGARSARRVIRRVPIWWFAVVLTIVLIVAGVAGYRVQPSKSGSSASDSAYAGSEISGQAPNFKLVDQQGQQVQLSDFRGDVVILAFMDSQCTDVCPLTAQQLRQAYAGLSAKQARSVVILGVNVNVQANTVADVATTTRKWHLDEVGNWHFLTGSTEELPPVWRAYGVQVAQTGDDLTHTPGIFLIDRTGRERWYISTPLGGTPWAGPPESKILLERIRQLL